MSSIITVRQLPMGFPLCLREAALYSDLCKSSAKQEEKWLLLHVKGSRHRGACDAFRSHRWALGVPFSFICYSIFALTINKYMCVYSLLNLWNNKCGYKNHEGMLPCTYFGWIVPTWVLENVYSGCIWVGGLNSFFHLAREGVRWKMILEETTADAAASRPSLGELSIRGFY